MNKINPSKVILISYISLIIIGTLSLLTPFATNNPISVIDALFTSTSAVTVTGLTVKNTATDFTLTGQIIILILIQIGGLGYMTLMTFFIILFGDKASLRSQSIIAEALNTGLSGIVKFLKKVILIVFIFELLGIAMLYPIFYMEHSMIDSLWYSLFHSVTAFNNAGFSVFPDNLMQYRSNFFMNFTIAFLIFIGGIGYYVINDAFLYFQGTIKKISTHSKVVLLTTFLLTLIGTLALVFTEYGNNLGVWKYGFNDVLLSSFFNSVSSRTAGFNTIDFATLTEASLFVIIMLMFIGASPGGTGGGIKTITVAVIWCTVIDYIKGRGEITVMSKRIDHSLIFKSLMILSLAFMLNFLSTLAIVKLESSSFLPTLFEVVSASATVGLSVGTKSGLSVVSEFSGLSKIILIMCMVIGKVGILSFALAISSREKSYKIGYPDSRLML